MPDAFILMNNWKNNPRNLQRYNMNKGVAFATKGGNSNKGNKKKTRTTSHATSAMKLVIILINVQRTLNMARSS